jgi:hypothetical protein
MKSFTRLLALIALGAAGRAGGLVAQVAGLPVRNAGIGTGIGIAGDIGIPNAAAGKGVAVGATGVLGLGPLGVSATVAHWSPKDSPRGAINSFGGTANLKIFGGPLIPISVTAQAGIAHYKQSGPPDVGGVSATHIPLGLGLALTIPNPVFSIKPWVAPRVDFNRTKTTPGFILGGVTTTSTDTNFGISGGIDLGFLSGLLVRTMYDRVKRGGETLSVFSLGIGFQVGK